MNKTVTVNIGGVVFHIDENAYERFKKYLESIRLHFTASEGQEEIMQDIESRIAEMFQDRVKEKQVITLVDVDEVTIIMGKPEDFGDEKPLGPEVKNVDEDSNATKAPKRLYRNSDDKLIGGVCSGVGAYFDVDTVWIRLGFAAVCFPIFFNSFFGSGILLYILLWFIIPEAKSTKEKLQMRGEPVNISNIEKNVTEEREQKSKSGTLVSRFFQMIGQIFRLLIKLIGKIIAVFFVLIGVVVAFAVFMSLLAIFKVPGTHYPIVMDHIFPGGSFFGWGLLGAVLCVGIPFLMIAYLGARMLFNVKKYSRPVGMTALSLWIIGFVICGYVGIRAAREFSQKQTIHIAASLSQPSDKKLYLTFGGEQGEVHHNRYWEDDGDNDWENDLRISFKDDELQSKNIKLDIVKSNTDSFRLEKINYSRGLSRKDAADRAASIQYSFTQEDTLIKFNPYFIINKNDKYRAQKVQLVLYVPEGGVVFLDKSLDRYIYDIENVMNILDRDMLGRHWKMTTAGLVCLDCLGTEERLGIKNGKLDILGEDGSRVKIDENGVVISGSENEVVRIDSNGIVIYENGKNKIINKNGVRIQ